jgi:hypothetical protein
MGGVVRAAKRVVSHPKKYKTTLLGASLAPARLLTTGVGYKRDRAVQAAEAEQKAGGSERMRLFYETQAAMEQGLQEGEAKAKKMTADIDYKKEAEEELRRARAGMQKGLDTAESLETKRRFRTQSRQARGALAAGGVRGGTAGQTMASAYRGMQESEAALSAAKMQQMEQRYNQAIARQQGLRLSLPLAYGRLKSSQATGAAQMAMANQPAPQQQPGLLGQIFGGLF